ncbi:EpsG family protein [Sporosarcina sp. YIM B06819]|uniref:EpsG family protein n=1 Tax=Sporosarcina sp. YIM B06819 TaxID=3081769 RepID=UPI00298CA5F7|nr:EpsG family protein [Sporosarcina sp. YIM B06819]
MYIYFLLIIFWAFLYIILKGFGIKYKLKKWNLWYAGMAAVALSLVMGLRHYSVGIDIAGYLNVYNSINPYLSLNLFNYDEWGYQIFIVILRNLGFGSQGYIIVTSIIISTSFALLFYRYSKNIFLSLFLHLSIGLFSMSMSGVRQTLAVCLILLAFHFIIKGNFIRYLITVFLASTLHNSALVFLPIYFLRNLKINKKMGIVLLLVTSSSLLYRKLLIPIIEFFMPIRYADIELISTFTVNPLLIGIALAIPTTCLLFWGSIEGMEKQERSLFSIFFVLSCLNAFVTILSLNSVMIGRLAFYFVTFNLVLIPNIIATIKDKKLRTIAIYLCVILPLIQFSIAIPDGVMRIDQYKFFWQ